MRLDHFLPTLAKAKGRALRPTRLPMRLARQVLPASWFSDLQVRRVGPLRRFLKKIGPTWLSSPLRRLIQAICLVSFLWMFFIWCWPYNVMPAPVWKGWVPVEIDAATGQARVSSDNAPAAALREGALVHVSDESPNAQASAYRGAFVVHRTNGAKELELQPRQKLTVEALENLSTSTGPWTLSLAPPGKWPSHYADQFHARERIHAETFLLLDPLVALSTSLAAKTWVWSLGAAGLILGISALIPRGFCGYLCPLGTVIDLFDWMLGRRVRRFRVPDNGWWVHIKYFLLLGSLVAAFGGVLVTGFVSAIPVLTRGLMFLVAPLQLGFLRGWHNVPTINAGQVFSIVLFFGVFCLGFLRPRFWCTYVCPSGAVFSIGNLFRVSERKVEDSCIHCNKCVEICPFDAIKSDFTTRVTDCTLCQTCGGVCPTQSIKFVERHNRVLLKAENDPPTGETAIGRRGFLAASAGTVAGLCGGFGAAALTRVFGARLEESESWRPVRPPGSVPEKEFLEMCIRCGECFKVCPNNVLQPLGFQQGIEGLWSPRVVADWAGCEPSCNACGQACPTGAIRALPLDEKRKTRMALAVVNNETCLPWAGKEACQWCVDECSAAGYHAIDFIRVHSVADASGRPVEGSGFLAPKVNPEKCVGCGLCQTHCFGVNVKTKKLLPEAAIAIGTGAGKEDRAMPARKA